MDIREEAIDRMLRIIDQVCQKFKIVICLPFILKQEKFRNIFKHNVEEFDELCKQFCNNKSWGYEFSITNDCSLKDVIPEQASQVVQVDSKCAETKLQLAEILKHLSLYTDEVIPIVNDSLDEISSNFKNIIEHIQCLKKIIEWKIRMTPKQLREYKVKLRNAKVIITITQEEIQKLENNFNEQIVKHNDVVKEFQDEIINLNLVIDEIKKIRNEELDREMNSYKTKLRGLRDDIDEKENNLNNQLETHEAMLKELMQVDIDQENLLQDARKKAERKCLASRNAHDHDLSKLDELKRTLEMQLLVTNNHYDNLNNEYKQQSILFTKLKKERELTMMQAFAQQLENFEKNRAARIIQRTWRAYRERKSSKKKKRTRRKK